jgi:predicted metalloprotease with PDZ domain
VSLFGRRCFSTLVVCAFCLAVVADRAAATIHYEISLAHPENHLFHVTMTIPDVRGEVTIQMPAWNALYQIRDFSSHVQEVDAFVGDAKVPIKKIDKQTWIIHANGTVIVRYGTYWDDPGPFGTQLNSEHAFINPATILMYIQSRRSESVEAVMPDVPWKWGAASPALTIMESMGGARRFILDASDYDVLADSPIEAGAFREFALTEIKPSVAVVVDGDHWTQSTVASELERICKYEIKLMGGAPFPHYTFILHIGKGANGVGGGMEHADGSAINVPSDAQLPGVAAHEFFHLWNVKRIRPSSLEPVDYSREQYTRALWFAEGVTSTYGAYALVRTGLWSKQDFYDDLSRQINMLEARPANKWQSAEQSSLDAWLEKYPWYNGPDFSISYYTKGQILGDLLDILIRDHTNNTKSLDDVMRLMNDEFAKQHKFYQGSLDVRLAAEKIAGGSFEDFFRRYVAGTDALPYQDILSRAGLELQQTPATRANLGFEADRGTGGILAVQTVDAESPAAKAGLEAGDSIILWNGGEPPRFPAFWAGRQKPGNLLRLTILRNGDKLELEFALGESQQILWTVAEHCSASDKARRIREGILKGITQKEASAASQ